MQATKEMTPYEEYLKETILLEKKNLDELYNKFAHSRFGKQVIKRRIDETLENIDLLSLELAKYDRGLSWLRESSELRDVKSTQLQKLKEEPQAKPTTPTPTPAVTARPTIGTPVKPTVGTPVATSRPMIGTPKKEEKKEQA